MDCREARDLILDAARGQLAPATHAAMRAHLATCTACEAAADAEAALTELLERRLPQHHASYALKRRLARRVLLEAPRDVAGSSPRVRRALGAAAVLGAAAALLVAVLVGRARLGAGAATASVVDRVVDETVNDHLRVLERLPALAVQSSDMHAVRPWFAGRLDFAPVVPFAGDARFVLQGGGVEYFLDRRAAAFVYRRRLHTISLFVFRANGLAWPPARDGVSLGRVRARVVSARGFAVILWQSGELAYAVASDLNVRELSEFAAAVAPGA